eukprot:gene1900-10164_t
MGDAQEGQKKQAEKKQAALFETGFSQKEKLDILIGNYRDAARTAIGRARALPAHEIPAGFRGFCPTED